VQLSPHFSLAQLIRSETAERRGIDNQPSAEILGNLRLLAAGLEAVQCLLGAPLQISSGYRCPELNQAVGGASTSQHMQGLAADFVCPVYGPPLAIAQALRDSHIRFDQCILEWGEWVHLSFNNAPRCRVLSIYDNQAGYLDGLWDSQGTRIG
jgi:hypothetical protein